MTGRHPARSHALHRAAIVVCASALVGAGADAQNAPSAAPGPVGELTGVWQGRLRLGPDVRGPLVIIREGDAWRADIAGYSAPGELEDRRLVFRFGELVGTLLAEPPRPGGAKGWWYQPDEVPMGSNVTPYAFATPLTIRPAGPGRWQTTIEPYTFQMTLYFGIGDDSAGTAPVAVRNPERNVGSYLNAERVARSENEVRFLTGDGEVTAHGTYQPERDLISFEWFSQGGVFTLERVAPNRPTTFYPRGFPTGTYSYTPPPALDDGWEVSTLEREGVSQAGIEEFIRSLIDTPAFSADTAEVHAVLVARNGKLILEEYFYGFDRHSLHDTRSAAKSFTATLAGAVIEEGMGDFGIDTPVYAAMRGGVVPDDLDPRKAAMTVEHLLTMSTGVYCDDGDSDAPANESVVFGNRHDWYAAMLDAPMESAPGSNTVYCSLAPNLLGGVIAATTGRPLPDLFRDLVATPLDMSRYALNLQPTGEPYMGGGLFVEARDFLKFAQLMLDGGEWRGRRIVSTDWVERATSPLRDMGEPGGLRYGYLWWTRDVSYKDRTVRVYYAAGNGGQTSLAVPELDLAVAFFAGNYGERVSLRIQQLFVPTHLLPAVR